MLCNHLNEKAHVLVFLLIEKDVSFPGVLNILCKNHKCRRKISTIGASNILTYFLPVEAGKS